MSLPLAQEKRLVERAREGDAQAFEDLIEAYTDDLYPIVLRMAQDEQQAEAIVQETFWRAWRALARYQSDQPFLPYLVTIATNLQRDIWRKEKRLFDLDLQESDFEDDQPGLTEISERKAALADLIEIVRRLPEAYRMVIALRYDAEMSYEQIAEALGIPINTVRTHLRRGKDLIRKEMGERTWMN